MSNLKKYNLFIFITSFAKSLIEVFIALILYDKGLSIKGIVLFMLLKYMFCSLTIPISKVIAKKCSFTTLMIISSFLFSVSYIYLNFMKTDFLSLIILASISAIYSIFYWLGRHIYALLIIEDKKATDNVSLYQIFMLLGSLFATYIGAKVISSFGYLTLSIIVLLLMVISIIPLIKMKNLKIEIKGSIKEIVSSFPKENYIFLALDQLRYIGIMFFPLYIYLFVKRELNYIGLLGIFCSLGSILYIYFIARKMDKNKKDYLKVSSVFLALTFILKLNVKIRILFIIVTFFEGIFKSSLDTIVLRNTYVYGKNYNIVNYILFIEYLNNIVRFLFLLIFYIINLNIKAIIIISIISIIINGFIGFDDGKYGYKSY